jgi:hypothetical protein
MISIDVGRRGLLNVTEHVSELLLVGNGHLSHETI